MSNKVKNAIDGGLRTLMVTERDVEAILRRARTDAATVRRPRRQMNLAAALAVVMAALLVGVGARLMLTLAPETTPLTRPVTEVTEAPAAPQISVNEAIARAEKHVHEALDPAVDLRDSVIYEIGCEWKAQERAENTFYSAFYEVRFRALDAFATEYTVWVRGSTGAILRCEVQRGAGEGHTGQEIYAGYARVFGGDCKAWSQEQLRTYAAMLKKADPAGLRWTDYLYMQSGYIDARDGALSEAAVVAKAMEQLSGADAQAVGESRARYLNAAPNPVWKVALRLGDFTTLLVEIDSVTGETVYTERVNSLYASSRESFLQSTIDALKQATMPYADPELPLDEAKVIAAEYIREHWGEERDVNDEGLFTLTVEDVSWPLYQCELGLCYTGLVGGERVSYMVCVDWYGEVIAANAWTQPADSDVQPFLPTAVAMNWQYDDLVAWQAIARASGSDDPVIQAFLNTAYAVEPSYGIPDDIMTAAAHAVRAKAHTRTQAVLIRTEKRNVWKLAMESDQGDYLIEVDSASCEVLNVQRVASIYESWYLPFILSDDLKAAGVDLSDRQAHFTGEADTAHGTVSGMRADHLYERFKRLYGPDLGDWTQAQLREFQSMLILSSDQDYDLAVPCLRNTVYPDLPEGGLSREAAAVMAAEALGLEAGWTLDGGVLIGTEDSPVWKLCFYLPGLVGVENCSGHWYVEVDCMTGEVTALERNADFVAFPGACYDNGRPANLWFRDIVLETTIRECDQTWESIGNG